MSCVSCCKACGLWKRFQGSNPKQGAWNPWEEGSRMSLKLTKRWHKIKESRTISVMNMDVKILDKMPANWIQQYIKRIIYHNQVGLPKECKVVLILVDLFIEHISGSNKWNHMIISWGAGRSFMKSQHQFLKGTFSIIPGADGASGHLSEGWF